MKNFGGDWTKVKIEILVEYAKAYLIIMNKYRGFKTLYFDGFAGTGFIVKDNMIDIQVTVGAARRIIELDKPKAFDIYYFVEKKPKNFRLLEKHTKIEFPKKNIHCICDDCNKKLIDLSNFLRNPINKNYRTLAYVDPCGMQLEWRSIESLRGLAIDLWILVPTGMGVNRLLKKDFQISDEWYIRLEKFLGLTRSEIDKFFYSKTETLFPEITYTEKVRDTIQKSAKLYRTRLKEVFNFISKPYELKNKTDSIMYHLFLASNNETAVKIGNDIVKKYNK